MPGEDMTDQPDDKTGLTKTRNGKGRFDRDPNTVKRDAEAADLRAKSWTYPQIGAHFGISKQAAHEAVQRAMADTLEEPAAAVRAMELEKLDAMERAALSVLEREHVTVSNGKVIRKFIGWERDDSGEIQCDGEGKPIGKYEDLLDDAPVLQAVDRLLRIATRRAALLGLDAEKKISLSGGVTYEIVGVDPGELA